MSALPHADDPSVSPLSILGFGAGLALLDDEIEIGRLFVGAIRSQIPAKLYAAAFYDHSEASRE